MRPAWGSGPEKGRNLDWFGDYLFFLAPFFFFFAGMISPPVRAWVRFRVGRHTMRPTSPTPQYLVALLPFVKRNLHSFPHSSAVRYPSAEG